MSNIESLLNSLKDILKYKAISYIKTGDPVFDNILTTFVLTFILIIFNYLTFDSLKLKYQMFYYKDKDLSDKNCYEFYYEYMNNKINENNFYTYTWMIREKCNENFDEKLGSYYFSNFTWKIKKTILLNTKTCQDTGMLHGDFFKELFSHLAIGHPNTIFPIYKNRDGLVGISGNSSIIYMITSDRNTLIEFVNKIKNINIENNPDKIDNNIDYELKVTSDYGQGVIFKDITFDIFVSVHKKTIVDTIECFERSQKEKVLGGYGSKNLGFLIHGKPGTGKTMLIKVICNKLKRHASIIDMRNIKTRENFANLFKKNIDKYVYVLDEFDCVQGAIYDRSMSHECKERTNPLKELKDRQLNLLSMSDKNNDHINKELAEINKEIKDYENRLTLDTILTVLDGTIEQRNRVIIAITNHVDRIDPALKRPGRFDINIELKEFNSDEIREILSKIFENTASKKDLEYLNSVKLKEYHYTPADIIHLARVHSDSLKKVVNIIRQD
jgi:AAA+ superfamily predicted ATPase